MKTTQQTIEGKHYVATLAEVESLAREHYGAQTAANTGAGTYLRVLVAACQAKLGAKRRGRQPGTEAQEAVVTAVNASYYPAVLRGVTTPDIAQDDSLGAAANRLRALERNRRSTFARSAVSTLRVFVSAGGDIRSLTAESVTKRELRAVAAPEPEGKTQRQIERAQGALVRALNRLARGDPGAAAKAIAGAMAALQSLKANAWTEADHGDTTTVASSPRRTRVGVPVMVHSP